MALSARPDGQPLKIDAMAKQLSLMLDDVEVTSVRKRQKRYRRGQNSQGYETLKQSELAPVACENPDTRENHSGPELHVPPESTTDSSAAERSVVGQRCEHRRILAVNLPRLLCELAESGVEETESGAERWVYGVIVSDSADSFERSVGSNPKPLNEKRRQDLYDASSLSEQGSGDRELSPKSTLVAVSERAKRFGVKAGQTLAEARAMVAHLQIIALPTCAISRSLQRIAEGLFKYGTCVSLSPPDEIRASSGKSGATQWARVMDTVWVDITGVAHLFDGEMHLCQLVSAAVLELGHSCRVGVANGPVLARALAKWQTSSLEPKIAEPHEISHIVRQLPVQALPIVDEIRGWLVRLGVLCFADLLALPRASIASRLGDKAGRVLELVHGIDVYPMVAFSPAELPVEARRWEEPVQQSEALLFVLRGLCSRVGVRLEGRGMAAGGVRLTLFCEPGIARFRAVAAEHQEQLEFAAPLQKSEDLFRVISTRLSRLQLPAPSVGMQLEVTKLAEASVRQLELSTVQLKVNSDDPEALCVLFAELAGEIGRHRFGTLSVRAEHRPEQQSLLEPVALNVGQNASRGTMGGTGGIRPSPLASARARVKCDSAEVEYQGQIAPTRLLPKPRLVSTPFRRGELMAIGKQFYAIEAVTFVRRLEEVEWWSEAMVSRDYVRLVLSNETRVIEVLGFVEHSTGQRYIQGVYD